MSETETTYIPKPDQFDPMSIRAFNMVKSRLDAILDDDAWSKQLLDESGGDYLTAARKQLSLLAEVIESDLKQISALYHEGVVEEEEGRNLRRHVYSLKRAAEAWGMQVELRAFDVRNERKRQLGMAIGRHRFETLSEGLEPTAHDLELWALLPEDKS